MQKTIFYAFTESFERSSLWGVWIPTNFHWACRISPPHFSLGLIVPFQPRLIFEISMFYNVSNTVLGMITWKYSVCVLHARLIFTCGQWNRWCERRICHAWLSGARLFLSTFWQHFICISCCICWVLNRGIGCFCGAGSDWSRPVLYIPLQKHSYR